MSPIPSAASVLAAAPGSIERSRWPKLEIVVVIERWPIWWRTYSSVSAEESQAAAAYTSIW
jgi:hypothetical protein